MILTNTGVASRDIYSELGNGTGWATYKVSKDRVKFDVVGAVFHHDPVGRKLTLNSNEVCLHEEVLLYNANSDDLVFPSTGRYYIFVDYKDIQSNIVPVDVDPPTEESDINGLQTIRSPDVLRQIYSHGIKDRAAMAKLKELADQPSAYSRYAAYLLAPFVNDTNAVALLQRTDVENFQLRSRALLKMARIYVKTGQTEKARAIRDRLLLEFPHSAAADELRRYALIRP